MKRVGLLLLFLLAINFFSFAYAEPEAPIDSGDIEKLEGAIDKLPFDEQGKIDEIKLEGVLGFGKSKAEGRIDEINIWLDENASWLKFFFRMKPQISWIFFLNIYFILLFSVIFGFNGEKLWLFIEDKNMARLFGFVVLLVGLMASLYVFLAAGLFHILVILITQILPATLMWATIAIIVITIILVLLAIYAEPVLMLIARWLGRMAGKHLSKDLNEKITEKATKAEKRLEQYADEQEAYNKALRGE